MGFLKGMATSILSFILFLLLVIFSVAFMFHGTILSPDFVSAQVDKVPITDFARDFTDEIISPELPQDMPFVKDIALNVVEKQEPWIKEQIKDVIDTGYDYLLGKSDTLSIIVPLAELKQNLQNTLWDETRDYLREQTAGKTEAAISSYLQDIIRQIPEDIIPPELDVLPRDLRNLAIEQYIRDFAGLNSVIDLPPEITAPIQEDAKKYFDQYLEDFIDEVPDTFTIDEASMESNVTDAIDIARTAVSYFQTYYYWLIVLMIVLAGLIFVVNMNIGVAARALGVNLTIIGVIDLVGIILIKTISPMQYAGDALDIPASLNTWLDGLNNDLASVSIPLTIGILVVGVALLVASFIFKPKKA